MIFFSSDYHLGHFNIIKYTNRPFKTLKEMDETIINNTNSRIGEEDTLFFLGDFCFKTSSEASEAPKNAFGYYREQIKCKNIIFIKGNHDKHNGVKSIIESLVIHYGGKRIYLTHDPKWAKEEFYWNFTGHCHGNEGTFRKLGKKSYIIDLSIDCWNFYPVNINSINQGFSFWLKSRKKNV